MDSANTAIGMLSGQIPARPVGLSHARPMGLAGPEAKRLRMDKDKPATYCRGCGATETPEWRRGPLGPRTLCNACVSVVDICASGVIAPINMSGH